MSTHQPVDSQHASDNTAYIILISLVATIGGFLFGYDSGVINGTIDGLQQAFDSDAAGTGFNVASMLLGCAVGAFSAGRLADRFGRRKLLMISAVFFLVSAWGSGVASSSLEFVFYRLLGGLAVGAASVMAPAYISEIAPARYRGALASIQQVAIIFGLFTSFLSNYFLAEIAGGSTELFWLGYETWRWMFWMELFPAALFLLLLLFIPESPRFLVLAGRVDESANILNRLHGAEQGKQTLLDIQQSLSESPEQPKLSDVLVKNTLKLKPLVWVGIGLACFQQFVGINVVFYYGAVLWQAVGFSESHALLINVISGGVSIFACLITLYLIDKIGRKPLLLLGSIGMTLTLGTMVFAFANASVGDGGNLDLGAYGLLALVAANAYVFFFNLSWGPVMWVMLGEMFPNYLRGSGLAVSGFAQWIANFVIVLSFPVLLVSIGLLGAYGIYAVFAGISIIFVYKMVKETKGITLENMKL